MGQTTVQNLFSKNNKLGKAVMDGEIVDAWSDATMHSNNHEVTLRFAALLSVSLLVSGGVVSGQDYPNKPIRIVTSGAGGGTDFVARLVAQGISGPLGQQVIIDNRPGIAVIPAEIVSKAPPDGYTLIVVGGTFTIGPLLEKWPYDPLRDFSPISLTTRSPQILVIHPSVPAKSVKDLIALAKARPGELNYGSAGTGSANHLGAELFKAMAGVSIVRVLYKGTGPALNDLIGGHVQLMFGSLSSVAPHVKSGRLRVLGITSATQSALDPALPTLAASGLPGYEMVSIDGVFAPIKTPAPIINRLNQEIVRVLNRSEVKEKFLSVGLEVVGSSPEEYAAAVKSQMTKMAKVIQDAGIKAD